MSTANNKGGKPDIVLLKRSKTKIGEDGQPKVFHNLYLQINGGYPIAIDLPTKLYNPKVKRLLLAVAQEFTVDIVKKDEVEVHEKDF